jgi:hypothetical protein
MDEFSWGNTRVVVGEGKEKKVLVSEEEKFDESMIPLKKFSGARVSIYFLSFYAFLREYTHRVRSRSLGNWITSLG